jgi:hypothetical protein
LCGPMGTERSSAERQWCSLIYHVYWWLFQNDDNDVS